MVEVVTAIIKDDNGKILICKNSNIENQNELWKLPCGKIEIGETDEEAITRGVKQDLNIEISVSNYITEKSFEYPEKTINMIVYDAKYEYGKPTDDTGHKWIKETEFDKYNFGPTDKYIINQLNKEIE
ncbi:MAG TPA: NUDIX domain-containing protein [Clostridia bacterium]|nr:NUDIX domain-containing protein [Clostridia bacterium]